jgi:hypothetical protein
VFSVSTVEAYHVEAFRVVARDQEVVDERCIECKVCRQSLAARKSLNASHFLPERPQ